MTMSDLQLTMWELGDQEWSVTLDRAFDLTEADPAGEARAVVLTSMAGAAMGRADYTTSLNLAVQASDIYRRRGMTVPLAIEGIRAQAACGLGDIAAADGLRSMARLLKDKGSGREAAVIYANSGTFLFPFEGPRGFGLAAEGIDFARSRGITFGLGLMETNRCVGLFLEGRLHEALARLDELCESLARRDDQYALSCCLMSRAAVLVTLGRGPEALECAGQALERATAWDDPGVLAQTRTEMVLALSLVGDEVQARQLLEAIASEPRVAGYQGDEDRLPALMRCAVQLGESPLVARICERLAPIMPLMVNVLASSRALMAEAAGDAEAGMAGFAVAADRWHDFGSPQRRRRCWGRGGWSSHAETGGLGHQPLAAAAGLLRGSAPGRARGQRRSPWRWLVENTIGRRTRSRPFRSTSSRAPADGPHFAQQLLSTCQRRPRRSSPRTCRGHGAVAGAGRLTTISPVKSPGRAVANTSRSTVADAQVPCRMMNMLSTYVSHGWSRVSPGSVAARRRASSSDATSFGSIQANSARGEVSSPSIEYVAPPHLHVRMPLSLAGRVHRQVIGRRTSIMSSARSTRAADHHRIEVARRSPDGRIGTSSLVRPLPTSPCPRRAPRSAASTLRSSLPCPARAAAHAATLRSTSASSSGSSLRLTPAAASSARSGGSSTTPRDASQPDAWTEHPRLGAGRMRLGSRPRSEKFGLGARRDVGGLVGEAVGGEARDHPGRAPGTRTLRGAGGAGLRASSVGSRHARCPTMPLAPRSDGTAEAAVGRIHVQPQAVHSAQVG